MSKTRSRVLKRPRHWRALHDAQEVSMMADLGLSARFIGSENGGLSPASVYYRLRLMKVKIKAYRDGQSPTANAVRSVMRKKLARVADARIAHAMAARP